jgi:hypothetical protein
MWNILSRFLIRKKEVLVERWLKIIKFSGITVLKMKPPGRQKIISIDIILGISTSVSVHLSNLGTRFFLREVGCDALGAQNSLMNKLKQRGKLM